MESMEVQPKRRGRKRKRNDVQTVMVDGSDKKGVGTRSLKLVDRYVRKEFQGSGVFLGKIVSYDSGLYRINYEDGDFEDLDSREAKMFLVEDGDLVGKWFEKKQKLDEFLPKTSNAKVSKVENTEEVVNSNKDLSAISEVSNGDVGANEEDTCDDAEADSSSDSCEENLERDNCLDMEVQFVCPPELPPSSGHIDIPEEYVSHLLSVHGFLRSFSVPLFLYPFRLDEFVGALNSTIANTLLDAVHVALMRVLKRHLENLASDGLELAVKCLRFMDWSLLDSITWPVYLVHYLTMMGHTNGPDWTRFCIHSLERDYYTLSAGIKLLVLQMLCDDVLDSEELKAEIDLREELEVGKELDASQVVVPTVVPRRVHPRYSKTSAYRDAMDSIGEHRHITYNLGGHLNGSQVSGPVENSIDEDGNGDECRLCGMDGFLLCCDGCPSSYHARCIGLNKMHMPEGSWYCPQCKINAREPKILPGTALKGGEIFGVDPHEQVFVATCDHLLVLKTSTNSTKCLKYYNRADIPRVLQALYSKAEHAVGYSEICRGVLEYWELPKDTFPCSVMSGVGLNLRKKNGMGETTSQLVDLSDYLVSEMSVVGSKGSCITGTKAEDMFSSHFMTCVQEPVLNTSLLPSGVKFNQPGNIDSPLTTIMTEPASFSGVTDQPAGQCELSQQSTSNVAHNLSYTTKIINVDYNGPANDTLLEDKASLKEYAHRDCCLYKGNSFKTASYINHYMHGDFAASAAANLAVLSSKENQVPESRSSDNRRKVMSASISLQVKAFSSAAIRFFWPHTEKKLVEVPRERCTWCFSCKAPVLSKRGCLLNAAASNATKGAVKVLAGVRPVKIVDGRFPDIAAYLIFMEESLNGLLTGPFLNKTFRKRWRILVEQATTCTALKTLSLELEANIRPIGLHGDWTKLFDGCSSQSAISQPAVAPNGSTQKRRPVRHNRKYSAVAEVAADYCLQKPTDFTWWRGSILSKLIFPRAVLPRAMIRKPACHGGSKKIPGIHYVEGGEAPKCSRNLIWRSAVEMSRNMAQLALQVRCLDFHVRWLDLVRPEQTPTEGKGPETEASVFRNASICDKQILGNETRYCIAFGSQKHLPSRVMKNIAEIEQGLGDGKERYWFSETRIPLYLIKEYEERANKSKNVDVLSELQRKKLKPARKNIFSYLARKRLGMRDCCSCHQDVFHGNAVKCSTCQGICHEKCATSSTVYRDEEVEFFITCKHCSENRSATHVESTNGSPTSPLLLQVQEVTSVAVTSKSGKSVGNKGSSSSVITLERSQVKSTNSSAATKKSKHKNWGLIWIKNNCEEVGMDFRLKHILLRGKPDIHLINPTCRLCNQPYNAEFTYIRCETCQKWYHAEALELDESKFSCLMGFKCCKCRRIKSPVCPYLDPEKKRVLMDKMERKHTLKQDISEMGSDLCVISEQQKEVGAAYLAPTSKEFRRAARNDPFPASLSEAEQCSEDKSEADFVWNSTTVSIPGPQKSPVKRQMNQKTAGFNPHPQHSSGVEFSSPFEPNAVNNTEKLPVRRLIKRENNSDCYSATNSVHVEASNTCEGNTMSSAQTCLSPQIQWVGSNRSFDDGIMLDYGSREFEDMEFEPQTYFSFNELLASNDGRANASDNVVEDWGNETLEISYDQEEPMMMSAEATIQIVPCKICTHSEPSPDLCCLVCGIWIHSYCSPWVESTTVEDGWRCGNCREWR